MAHTGACRPDALQSYRYLAFPSSFSVKLASRDISARPRARNGTHWADAASAEACPDPWQGGQCQALQLATLLGTVPLPPPPPPSICSPHPILPKNAFIFVYPLPAASEDCWSQPMAGELVPSPAAWHYISISIDRPTPLADPTLPPAFIYCQLPHALVLSG